MNNWIGHYLYYIDPHETLIQLRREDIEMSTYQASQIESLPVEEIDQSLAFAFYCHDEKQFEDLCQSIEELNQEEAPIISIAQSEDNIISSYNAVNDFEDDWSMDDF